MYIKQIDYEALKEENFQLKNEITDLKNGFDLNRDVLKILEEQSKQTQPKLKIFYQIISRLTSVNNQTMLTNLELVQERNKIKTEKLKLQNQVQTLNQKIDELAMDMHELYKPKEIHFQLKEQIKNLHSEIMASNEECLRKKFQISHLQKIIKEKEQAQMKKPIIPSVLGSEPKIMLSEADLEEIPKTYLTNQEKRFQCLYKETKRQNMRLKSLIQQFQYRLTLLSRIYNIQPPSIKREMQESEKMLTDQQLSLLMFALHNTELKDENDENQTIKLTITKRAKIMEGQKSQSIDKCKSMPKL